MRRFRCVLGIVFIFQAVGCGSRVPIAMSDDNEDVHDLTQGCQLDGTWAIKFEIPVSWPATLAIEAGRGTVVQWAKAERHQQGTTLSDVLTVCGVSTPDLLAREVFNRETYGVTFPPSLFDKTPLPSTAVTTTLTGSEPGATFATQTVAVLLGLTLDNAPQAVWPTRASGIRDVDTDRDDKPGITVQSTQGGKYAFPPVNMFRSKRAAKFYIALRNVVQSAKGRLDSCDRMSGTATIPVIAGKAAINSRIVGCQRVDGPDCTAAEHELIDKLQSGYNLDDVAGAATVKMQRIAAGTACDAVRGMAF